MKKFLILSGITAFVAWITMNISLALTGEKSVWVNWETAIALTNNEAPKIVYTFDASGNMISRTLVQPSMAPPPPIVKDSAAVALGEMGKVGETGESGTSSLKSTVSRPGSTNSAVPEIPELGEEKITVYPNPTRGLLRVDIANVEIPNDARIYLYNVQGAMVRQLMDISAINELDISEQPAGTYIMRIMMDKDNISTWTIIKN